MPVGNAALITRCPDCATAFRATAAQLALREGRVRCGNCGIVFDARENAISSEPLPTAPYPARPADLVPAEPDATSARADAALVQPDETSTRQEPWDASPAPANLPDDQAPTALAPAADEASRAALDDPQAPDLDLATDAAPTPDVAVQTLPGMVPPVETPPADDWQPEPAPQWSVLPVLPDVPGDEAEPQQAAAAPATAPEDLPVGELLVLEPAPAADPAAALPELPAEPAWNTRPTPGAKVAAGAEGGAAVAEPVENLEFDFGRRRATRSPLSPWLAWPAAMLLLLALVAQVAFTYRGDLALLFPVLKPHAEALCDALGCKVPLPRRAELMSIESSDLQADGSNASVMVLSASLRNRAPFAQTPPALELTLTDTQDQPVARRVLSAADYLGAGSLAGGGASALIPAGTEIPVKVYFDASALKATGYRLYLFYP